jgi:hypothetical protein
MRAFGQLGTVGKERQHRTAGDDYDRDDTDIFIDTDIGYPNRRAQYRGHLFLVFGVLALVGGVLQSGQQIGSAFPTLASLQNGAAWGKFFEGFGRLIAVGLFVIFVALILRWRIRRARRR